MDVKAKNIYFSGGEGLGCSGVRDMDPPSLGSLRAKYSHILRPILRKLAIVIFRQQFKAFDSNNFTMSLMFSFENVCP